MNKSTLVASGIGISFLYNSVVSEESDIGTFFVEGITDPHAFHVVYTRNTNAIIYAERFLKKQAGSNRNVVPNGNHS